MEQDQKTKPGQGTHIGALTGITQNLPTRCVVQLGPVEDITLMSSLRLFAFVVIVTQIVHILLVTLFPNYNS